MKKRFILAVGFLSQLITGTLFAQEKTESIQLKPQTSKSLLWKISGNGLKKPSYLFGTIHAICADDYFFTDKMKSSLDECKQLILEINLEDPTMIEQYQNKMMLPSGKELKSFFTSEELYETFAKKVHEKTGFDVALFAHFKPIVLISALSMKGLSCAVPSSYEMNLITMSQAKKMKIEGLETTDAQLELFEKMSDKDISAMLSDMFTDSEHEAQEDNQLVNLYKKQDIEGLYNMIVSSSEMKGHEAELITNRNKNWAVKIPSLIQNNQSFIAVGAGHLYGKEGLIQLLKEKNYTLEAIVSN